MSIEDEINEIEEYIKTLESNDDTNKGINNAIKDGMSKGLIFDFIKTHYRGTMFSSKVIKKEEYDEFQKYINRCEEDQSQAHNKFVEDIIKSDLEYSKDISKYNKLL